MGIKQKIKQKLLTLENKTLTLCEDVLIGGKVEFGKHCRLNERVIFTNSRMGDYSYINYNTIVAVTAIGKFTSIGPNCVIGLGNHPTRTTVSTSPFLYKKGLFLEQTFFAEDNLPVKIGSDVWIGAGVTILNGVTIGDGAIVGANSVVVKDIPPYSIVGGYPASFIRKRFTEEEIEFLSSLEWWDKGEAWIQRNATLFQDIKQLYNKNQ